MDITVSRRIATAVPYAFADIERQVETLKAQGVQVIDFGVGDPKDPTPDFLLEACDMAVRKRARSGYPSYIGDVGFRQAAAEYMKRCYGVDLDPATEISSSIGTKESVFSFPLGFTDPGDIVICPTPGYPVYGTGTRFAGCEAYFVPLLPENDFLIDVDSIPEDIAHRAKIIWTNYPNSPTAKCAPRAWLEKLVAWANKYNIIIAADEGCYNDIWFDAPPVSILSVAKEGVITFYSLSKRNNMTGWRVGFVAGDARIIQAFRRVKTNIDSGTPTFIQDVAAVALRDDSHAEQMRASYKAKREIMLKALENAGLPPGDAEATFYIWQRAPEGRTGLDLAKALLKHGIVVMPGSMISQPSSADGTNPGEKYVRIALVASLEDVKEAAARLAKGLDWEG